MRFSPYWRSLWERCWRTFIGTVASFGFEQLVAEYLPWWARATVFAVGTMASSAALSLIATRFGRPGTDSFTPVVEYVRH